MADPLQTPIKIDDPFSTDALAQDVQNLDKLPSNQADIGMVASDGDFGVEGEVSKSIGKQGVAEAEGSWLRKAGWSIAAKFGWKW